MTAPHNATLRLSLRSALSHRRLANEILDSILDTQEKFNATMDKLDADSAASLDTDYESSNAVTDLFEADAQKAGAQHKATLRRSLRSALSNRKMADEIADSLEEIQTAYNAMLVKLDAEAGTLNDTDYESSLGVELIDPESPLSSGQHKATFRRALESALSHSKLADTILDSIKDLQDNMNQALGRLDSGTINGLMAAFKVTEIKPDQA